jgi:Na+-translocating ferredoxin:NAD+ oxidoreductase RnfA subunit
MKLEYLNTIAFILVIASLVQVVEMFLKKSHRRSIRRWASPAADYDELRRARA